jgi:mRNA interferase MazF
MMKLQSACSVPARCLRTFAVKITGSKGVASYILRQQPKSFDWRARKAKPHPFKRVPEDSYAGACESLNQIIQIGS